MDIKLRTTKKDCERRVERGINPTSVGYEKLIAVYAEDALAAHGLLARCEDAERMAQNLGERITELIVERNGERRCAEAAEATVAELRDGLVGLRQEMNARPSAPAGYFWVEKVDAILSTIPESEDS